MQISSGAVIEAFDLAVGYVDTSIWQHADFTIKDGEFVGVLGPNGAGKTTLFRLLLGFIGPKQGELKLFNDRPKRGDARIGYVPQRRPIDSETRLEALELVRLGLNGTRWGFSSPNEASKERKAALDALKVVDALELAHRPLGSLSGGELQRVFLAQAVIGKPKLLLLDEPLANLDIRREGEFIKLISQIAKRRNIAVLLIAHDINPLLPAVDRIIYIANGKIASGEPDKLITSESLSALYNAPVEVLRDSRGRVAVLGAPEALHHD
ncbi:MAG: transporter related [Candidatus Saccharibacteria bacterium]|nr:transporter related [Candidatus Saccharibacteria bacterium]